MPRYKLSPEERVLEQERKENLRNIMKRLDVKNFDDLKDVFKMMVGEMNYSQVSRHKKAHFFRGSGYFVCAQY